MSKQTYPFQKQVLNQGAPAQIVSKRVPKSRTWAHTLQLAKSSEPSPEPEEKKRTLTFGRFRKKRACSKLLNVMNTVMFTPGNFHAVGATLPNNS